MANAYFYSNIAVATTLTGNINNSVTTATVLATTGWPGTFPYIAAFDYGGAQEELVSVTANSAGTLTIVRGFGGTSAVSHSTGAVVRLVYNAQDATDFRTHEAATASVHGVTGALVGATQTQTLTNKTLTSPTINGGALSGTFTGSPTLSGNPIFSGSPDVTGVLKATHAAAGDAAVQIAVTGDTNARLLVNSAGTMTWGPGNAAGDTNLYRTAANELKTDDALTVIGELKPANLVRASRAAATDSQYETRVGADANARWFAQADGKMWWGPGTAGVDTNLYRNAANELKTDDNFSAANIDTGAWTTYTPTWTAETGTNPTLGNGSLSGRYYKQGRKVTVFIRLVWGSTSAGGNGGGAENWVFGLPTPPAAAWNTFRAFVADARDDSNGQRWGGMGSVNTTGSGGISTIQATDHTTTAVWDSSAPFTWATDDSLQIIGTYESAS